jgi:hypothetical protein
MPEIRDNSAYLGLNTNSIATQIKQGQVTFAQNAVVEGFDGKSVTYQNEQANDFCCQIPEGFKVLGNYTIIEKNWVVFWIVNPDTGDCQIGRMINNDCVFRTDISSRCLNFDRRFRIRKPTHKITNCSVEVYWTDTINGRRWLDFNNLPYTTIVQGTSEDPCAVTTLPEIDCNKLSVQPNFSIPQISYERVTSEGSTLTGAYQFAVQYCNSLGEEYTSYFSVTDPIPLNDFFKVTENFNEITNQAVLLNISDLDTTGVYQYFNLAVIKTINNITSVDLVATYNIERSTQKVIYTGQSKSNITLTIDDIFEKFPVWDQADDVTSIQDILAWTGMTTKARVSYQKIFNKVNLNWCSYRISKDAGGFKDPINAANHRGYMRDEVYPFDAVIISKKGYQSDRFPIPGRVSNSTDLEMINNADTQFSESKCETPLSKPRWQVYNTASVSGKLFTPCPTVPPPNPRNPSNIIQASISLRCIDKGCTEQGPVVLSFNLASPLTQPLNLLFGMVWHIASTSFYQGSDIFTPPGGAVPDSNYSPNNQTPFLVSIPSGVTTFVTSGSIPLKNSPNPFNNYWSCQSCLDILDDLYIKADDGITKLDITTSDNNYTLHIINPTEENSSSEQPTQTIDPNATNPPCNDNCYLGPYEYGEFAFWESSETYPCNEEVWGELQGQKIRHHKFPDSSITHHYDNDGNIYPLGVRVDIQAIYEMIKNSPDLSQEEKDDIAAIKIVRGNRNNSKSVIAKGLLYNVGKYRQQDEDFFYPNYPYNDLREDPFISVGSNAPIIQNVISNTGTTSNNSNIETLLNETTFTHGDYYDGVQVTYSGTFSKDGPAQIKLYEYPVGAAINSSTYVIFDSGDLNVKTGDKWSITLNTTFVKNNAPYWTIVWAVTFIVSGTLNRTKTSDPQFDLFQARNAQTTLGVTGKSDESDTIELNDVIGGIAQSIPEVDQLDGFSTDDSRQRFTFFSPDTTFYQPYLGNILKLETAEYGVAKSHFTQVKDHSRYKFPSLGSFIASLVVGVIIGFASGTYGVADNIFNGTAAFTAFTVFNDIVFKILPRKNFAYSFNSVGEYTAYKAIPDGTGQKIRQLDIAAYLSPGLIGVGDTNIVNNYQRESSVYLKTNSGFPFPHEITDVPQDSSRYTLGQKNCDNLIYKNDISAYYGSIKTISPDQYGEIYSYEAIDTGFQFLLNLDKEFDLNQKYQYVFGGDTFINKFALKRKLPFFLDNRVGFPDDADISYEDVPNIGFTTYWFSTDITRGEGGNFNIGALFGVKLNHFDCKRQDSSFFYDAGKIYLFAYGIPYFYVESTVNVDYRQAINQKEGDFFPRVSSGIPDAWLQENFVSINYDNTYFYNKSFSKQNIENFFSTLPVDFIPNQGCSEYFPNKSVYSEKQQDVINYKKNNWLVYRPVSYFDFPLTYGKLIGLEGITDSAVLAKFENKSMIYNAMLTVSTSNSKAAYLGNDTLFKSSPPIDFVETDTGYIGTQHEFFLRTEYGNIMVDAKRGQVFILSGRSNKDLSEENMQMFFSDQLKFKLGEYFPDYDTDNHFLGVGLTGTYDTKYNRVLITKLDYIPNKDGIIYDSKTNKFLYNNEPVELTDTNFFCSVSFTLSYSFKTNSWISFHSYLPNYYIDNVDQFYTGDNNNTNSFWIHNKNISKYNNFYGKICPYVVEYPFAYRQRDEILQCVVDYTKVNKVLDQVRFVQLDDVFFNKAIIYNDQQSTGILNLVPKPLNNIKAYLSYPKIRTDSKDILVCKSDNSYYYNGFWDVVKDYLQPIWAKNCVTLPTDKTINQDNMNYSQKSYQKFQIRAKDSRIRHILDNRDDVRLISEFVYQETQQSYK